MSSTRFLEEVAAVRAAVSSLGARLSRAAVDLPEDELFELAGALQGLVNAAEGAQLVAVAHAASHETRLTDRGPVAVSHQLGFVDAMASTEVSLATGTGQWAAGRRVSLAASLAERFPRLLASVVDGTLCTGSVQKVVAGCAGLDSAACTAVEAVLLGRLPDLDPSRVTTLTRRVATRVAADQVRDAQARNRRDRCVQVSPGPDGTTTWWCQLPAGPSAAAWAAVSALGERYADDDPSLTPDQARADALLDLLLTNVTVTGRVTLGIPVIRPLADLPPGPAAAASPLEQDGSPRAGGTGATRGAGRGQEHAVGGQGLGPAFSVRAALDGCELPGIGWIDADTVEALLTSVPLEVGRALLDARTGTLVETTSTAYSPPRAIRDFVTTRDGTCRMWGCDRPATTCDLDHARPWPAGATGPANLGGLCRRHHRLKQRRRWSYRLCPDGTATWTSPTGTERTSRPDHACWPPPAARAAPRTAPTSGSELEQSAASPF